MTLAARPIRLGFLLLMVISASPALAQTAPEGLTVTGSMRIRYEFIDGQLRTGFNKNDDLVNLRTDIFAQYRRQDFHLGLEVFDSRVWGGNAGTPITNNEVNTLEPVQAYVAGDFDGAFGKGTKLTVTAGRMMLNVGSRRLVAADDYRNTTNSYTGVHAEFTAPHGWRGTLIYSLPQIRLPDDNAGVRDAKVRLDKESFDLVLWGGQISKAAALGHASAELTYFHLGERDAPGRPTRDRSLDTYGGRIIAEPHPNQFDYEVEAFYQTGQVSTSLAATAPHQSVRANFVHADVGYTFKAPWTPRWSVELDRASGDKPGGHYGRFDTLFGMRRADFSPSGINSAIGRANIMTVGVRVEATPSKRVDWFATYHPIWLAAREDSFSNTGVRDPSGRSGNFAGHQLEGRLRYWLVPAHLRFEFDGMIFAQGRFLQEAPNAPPGKWTKYGSFNLTASF